ncbi:MAG: hypothetical protein Q7R41_02725 [Phycisphaerales bacterium]|nr:hypothetical protein [Phycisphaerales bacterium]
MQRIRNNNRLLPIVLLAVCGSTTAWADVGPPVKIRLVKELVQPAVAGEEYHGAFEVLVGADGTLDSITVEGVGWRDLEVDAADVINVQAGDVLQFHFTGTPGVAQQGVRMRLAFDGRPVSKSFDLSPERFARLGKPGRVAGVDAQGRAVPFQPKGGGEPSSTVAGQSLHLFGRIVYQRPTSPMDPTLITVGADSMWFEINDDDSPDPFDDTIYSGYTDAYGYFDVNVTWDDCDVLGCDDPDIYLRWETDNDVVNVQRDDLLEEDYSWSTEDDPWDDFEGSEINFGTVMPGDPAQFPAIHIHNSIMRAYHYILLNSGTGIDVEEVDVQWPEDETGSGAFYEPFYEEIHIAPSRQWNEDTHTHEYGHHFLNNYSVNPEPDYCNGVCDFNDVCGHCQWCSETDHDAWNEGWPNWLADVVTRFYPLGYNNYQPYATRSQESIQSCTWTTQPANPFLTEGYAGALCTDIEDATQDDHDGDAVFDCDTDAASLGPAQIFQVVILDKPTTIAGFIAAFRARFPQFDQDLWSTVRNVAPQFSFPLPPPTVVSQTQGCQTYISGENLALEVRGNGTLLKYQWRRDGVDLLDTVPVQGLTTPNLYISPLADTDTGTYDCVVTTCDGTLSVTSAPIRVQVFAARGGGTNGGSWGRNDLGQLGRGVTNPVDYNSRGPSTFPAPMVALSDAVSISRGSDNFHELAIKSDGTVWGWGYSASGQLGTLGVYQTATPIPVSGLHDIVQVGAGTYSSVALTSDGKVLTLGDNSYGQRGISYYHPAHIVSEVPGLDCVVSIAAGSYHVAVVKSDGTVWDWGYDIEGALGRGIFVGTSFLPGQVPGISNAVSVAAGYSHTLVLLDDGTVLAFGGNGQGQLGDGTLTSRATPAPVQNLSGVSAIRAGSFHSLAILQDRTVRGWGNNQGALGTGEYYVHYTTPVQPLDVGTVLDVVGGPYHTVFLRTDRTVWVTGWDYNIGALGPRPNPEPYRPLPVAGINNALAIGAGSATSFVLTAGMGPQIPQQPSNQTKTAGQAGAFTVLAFGTATLTYQWSRGVNDLLDGNGVSGANSATLTLNPVSQAMAGSYTVRIQNGFGQAISLPATLTVNCVAGDANCDGFIDAQDAADLADCLNGPGNPRPPECAQGAFAAFDMDGDGDVDLDDHAVFQRCFAGDGEVVDPNCAN